MTNLKTMRDIENNEGRKVRVRLNGETFEATIVKGEFETCGGEVRGAEGVHSLRYDHERGLCSYWSPFNEPVLEMYQLEGCELLGTKLDKHNIPYNLGKRVAFKGYGEVDYGELVQGSFYDCAGEYRDFEDDVISIRFDERTSRGTTICSEIDNMLGIANSLGFELELVEEPKFRYGDVVVITSSVIRGIMKSEGIELPYGMYLESSEICGDELLKIEGLDKKHDTTWLVYEEGVQKLEPIKNPQQGDRILVQCFNDELVHGLYVPEGANYYDKEFDIKQSEHRICVTSDGREILLNNMDKVYRIEEVI